MAIAPTMISGRGLKLAPRARAIATIDSAATAMLASVTASPPHGPK